MPRGKYKKRTIKKDLFYKAYEVAKLVNYVMKDGKKSIAQRLVYQALEQISKKNLDVNDTLTRAINNVAPSHEVKPKRVGGASYLVPIETRPGRKIFLALNWIIEAANKRPNKEFKNFANKLFVEVWEASEGRGEAVNKRRQVEKLAEANKAFAHFRW